MYRTLRPLVAAALCIVSIECASDRLLAPLSPPTLASIGTMSGVRGTAVTLALTGTNFVARATTVAVSGGGVTVTGVDVTSATSASASLAIDANAALGPRNVTVLTAGGPSAVLTFVVNPPVPTVATVLPAAGMRGTTQTVAIAGTNFVTGATNVVVSGAGVSVRNVNVASATQLTADLAIDAGAATGDRTMTISTAGGASGAVPFSITVQPPTLSSVSPAAAATNTIVDETLKGTNFVGGVTVLVGGNGVTPTNVVVVNDSTITARFILLGDATLGAHTVTVMTAGGMSSGATFTVNPPPATAATITPNNGVRGSTTVVSISGANFVVGATSVAVAGPGVTASNVVVSSSTSLTATFTVDTSATLGAHDVAVITAGGSAGGLSFTVNARPPTLTNATPGTAQRGETISLTLTGTGFVSGGTTVNVGGAGVTPGTVNVTSSTSLTVSLVIGTAADVGSHDVTVTTAGGTSLAVSINITAPPPTLASITPPAGVQGTAVAVTLTGTNFSAGTATIAVSGTGVVASNVVVVNGTTITATLTIDIAATSGAHAVTVTNLGGTSGAQTFTVNLAPPTLTAIAPSTGAQTGSQTVTLTGTNFVSGATTLSISGLNVTASNVVVASSTSLTATLAVGAGAALGARDVKVATTGGTTAANTFTVVVPPTISTFNALATHLRAAQPARLRWATSNSTTCSINNGVGSVASCNDSLFVTPGTTKTYTLSATSAGVTVTANFQLFANEAGRFVYWTSSGGGAGTHVHQATMDATTGNLTLIGAGTVASGNGSEGIAVDPSGKYAYVANSTSNTVSMYSIDATTGALTSLGTKAAGTNPTEVAVDPTGRFAYVLNNNGGGTGSISRYSIDATGLLVANGSTTLGANSKGIAIDGTGRFVYATNSGAPSVQEFSINADGTLTALGTISTGSGTQPFYLAADPSGRYVYLTQDTNGKYSEYSINANGTLSVLGGGPISLGTGTDQAVAVDPTAHYAYIVDYNNSILHEFTLDQTTGVLTPTTAPTLPHTLPTTQTIIQFAIDPQGKFAYATDSNNGNIIIFTIGANGALSPVTAPLNLIAGGTNPYGIVVTP